MALPPRTRTALAFALVALAFFVFGLLAAGRLGAPDTDPPDSGPPGPPDATVLSPSPPLFPPAPPANAGPAEPRIVLDPSSVELLPDASLRLSLPPGFGGGSGGSPDGSAPR